MEQPKRQLKRERRRTPRCSLTLDISVQALPALGSKVDHPETVIGRTENLSESGICVLTPKPMETASMLLCNIELPFAAVSVPTLMLVKWTHKSEHNGTQEFESGLQFLI